MVECYLLSVEQEQDCFMSAFKQKLELNSLWPRFRCRYVNDIFVSIDREKIEETLQLLNSQFGTDKLTHETEENNMLHSIQCVTVHAKFHYQSQIT